MLRGTALLLLFILFFHQSSFSQDSDSAQIQTLLQEVGAEFGVPGMAAAVVVRNEIHAASTGVKILGKEGALKPASRLHIGSVTKPMTATVIATVVESGKLQWDTRILDVFPEWKATIDPAFLDVTLADLLAHQAGVQPYEEDAEIATLPEFQGSVLEKRLSFAHHALKQKPAAKPRQEYKYSNAGFVIAAAMAEKITGESWEMMMKKRLFQPLGMTTAGFGWPAATHPDEPWGHWITDEKRGLEPHDPAGMYQLGALLAPAGDVYMSVADLGKFARFHLQALQGQPGILKPETVKQMHTRRIKSGLGWGIQKLLELDPVSVYAGSAGTFNTLIALVQKQNTAVIVAANAYNEDAENACKKALVGLLQKYALQPMED